MKKHMLLHSRKKEKESDRERDQVIGEVVFNDYDEETRNVNFRVLLSESSCNKGVGTAAISMFIRYGMEELELHKISLEVYSFNPRAERALKTDYLGKQVKKACV